MTVKSKKRRLERRRAHAERRDNRGGTVSTRPIRKAGFSLDGPFSGFTSMRGPDLVIADEPIVDNVSEMQVLGNSVTGLTEIPTRAKCPTCGFSQKVRKNGAMSRHDVYVGSDARECEGSGKRWDSG